ncbi:MAG TPA: phosphatidate cytidylyltransferase [Candidatus Gastranaerophilaceae bacterium]|nr:phosphatidate cytidylyltransferase [Candidatus Gastranaerophilaceae bacterium]HPT41750.1 phosphatidate cytidylyltransferase [Candidatus Gastranaerophilaceae bacterium]
MNLTLNKNAKRIITGSIMGLIALWCLIYGGIALLALITIVVFLGSKEYVLILENKGFFPSLKVILFSDAVFALLCYFNRFDLVAIAFTICSITAFLWVLFKGRQPYIANVSTTILGFVYGGWFPLHLLLVRGLNAENYHGFLKLNIQNDGLGYVMFLFTVILFTDTGCYYFGKKFGKHKLAAVISPNKTIEGAVGGTICAVISAFIVGHYIHLAWYHCLVMGLLCTTFAQLGDLSESLIKRDAGVKDSGNTLPGHGGFLDRTDSYVLTIPVMFYYLKYFVVSNQLWFDFVNFIKGFLHALGV